MVAGPVPAGPLAWPAGGELVVGRDPACGLVVADPRVSGRHARLRAKDGGIELEDLRSANGTRVNDVEVARRELAAGDRIELGPLRLEVRAAGEPGRPAASPAAAGTTTEHGGTDRRLLDALAALLGGGAGEGVYERMLEALLAALGADRGAVFTPAGRGFKLLSLKVRPGAAVEGEEQISRSLLARVLADGLPMLLTSAETEELRQSIKSIAGSLRSIMAVPLATGQGRAVVYLDSALERQRFRESERDLLVAFVTAAGRALAGEREREALAKDRERLDELQRRTQAPGDMIGTSPAMQRVRDDVARAAATDVTVLVLGESGTGKELVARALHQGSARRAGSFVAVNCAAIPAELVESELFGHEKGAFTGAEARRLGRFELAHGGTLFLDEVGELPAAVQGKLLRALQERSVTRVGGNAAVPVDFRLICATHVDLGGAIRAGRFREDLFYRIAVFRIELPPLRARGADVLALAEGFVEAFARELGRPARGLSAEVRAALAAYPWPGNIRELRNVVEQAVVREDGPELTGRAVLPALGLAPGGGPAPLPPGAAGATGLPPAPDGAAFAGSLDGARRAFERGYLLHHLAAHKGNMKATAEAIGLSRKALYLKCDEYGIDYSSYRGDG